MAPGIPDSDTHRRRRHVRAHVQEDTDLRRDQVLLSKSKGNRPVLHDVLLAHVLKVACLGAQLHAANALLLLQNLLLAVGRLMPSCHLCVWCCGALQHRHTRRGAQQNTARDARPGSPNRPYPPASGQRPSFHVVDAAEVASGRQGIQWFQELTEEV